MINQIKTGLLLVSLTSILLIIGYFLGGMFGNWVLGVSIAFGIAMVTNVISYWWSDKIVLKMYICYPADSKRFKNLHTMIERLSKKAGIPKPAIYIMPVMSSNAFATGRNPEHASVAVTEGIIDLLSDEELEGVLAHEISHIKNRDILIQTVAATIAGAISFIAFMARWAAIFGGVGRSDDSGHSFIELIVLAILAPIIALIIQLAISRSREYIADESGAKLIGEGKPLAVALQKISAATNVRPMPFGNEITSHMFIVAPFKNFLATIFSTHPPVEKRVEKLNEIKF